MNTKSVIFTFGFVLFFVFPAIAAVTTKQTDSYITGYATSLLKQKYSLDTHIEVRNGIILLPHDLTQDHRYDEILAELLAIDGITDFAVAADREIKNISTMWLWQDDFMFQPLMGDPRWPKFSISSRQYISDGFVKNALEGEMGKTFSIVRKRLGNELYFEMGFQAGTIIIFDEDTHSSDMINSDYILGTPLALKYKDTVFLARFYHRSSHMGDEFMLRMYDKKKDPDGKPIQPAPGVDVTVNDNYVKRLNLSYETLEIILSHKPMENLRLYGGGNIIIKHNSDYDTGLWGYVAGGDLRLLSFVFALNVRGDEGNGYKPAFSSAAGLELVNNVFAMLEFYHGPSQHGQFGVKDVTYVGFGIHFYR